MKRDATASASHPSHTELFRSYDLLTFFNGGRSNEPLAGASSGPWLPSVEQVMPGLPIGPQTLRGVPFALGDDPMRCWIVFGHEGAKDGVVIPAGGFARFLLVAHFANTSQDPSVPGHHPGTTVGAVLRGGEHLADYVLTFADGSEHVQPIRRLFEIQDSVTRWGFFPFAAVPHCQDRPVDFHGPHARNLWGVGQFRVAEAMRLPFAVFNEGEMEGNLWLYALENPFPDRALQSIRIQATGRDTFAIAGMTAYSGLENPFRYQRLTTLRVRQRRPAAQVPVSVDLGVVARTYSTPPFDPSEWLGATVVGWGEPTRGSDPAGGSSSLTDLTASLDATVSIGDWPVAFRDLLSAGETTSPDGDVTVSVVSGHRVWVRMRILDSMTRQPVPARVHLRSPDGRYLPPYGHSFEPNSNAWEDFASDLVLGSTPYAYVDGSFSVELPVGDVFVEIAKGFEYQPVRRRIEVTPTTTAIDLEIARTIDWRASGWVTADTHAHYISPQVAWLEGQAEGLNFVNVLAMQAGDQFMSGGDYTGTASGVSTDDTLIWVGTENRSRLGHILLLGMRGSVPVPWSAGGPNESYLGDPLWCTIADWADAAHDRGGLAILGHYPVPYTESFVDILLGKIDAVEILRDARGFPTAESTGVLTWYRMLNLGCRVPCVGGSDKVEAAMPLGSVRTYAYIGDASLTFESWAQAVRDGRTFSTTGPLIDLRVNGLMPGAEIRLPTGGGSLDVELEVVAQEPFDRVEVIRNGRVVHTASPDAGGRTCRTRLAVDCAESGWVAARVWGRHLKWYVFPLNTVAHTSPVYLAVEGTEVFGVDDARHVLTMIDGIITYLDALAIRVDEATQTRHRETFLRARSLLASKLALAEENR